MAPLAIPSTARIAAMSRVIGARAARLFARPQAPSRHVLPGAVHEPDQHEAALVGPVARGGCEGIDALGAREFLHREQRVAQGAAELRRARRRHGTYCQAPFTSRTSTRLRSSVP